MFYISPSNYSNLGLIYKVFYNIQSKLNKLIFLLYNGKDIFENA